MQRIKICCLLSVASSVLLLGMRQSLSPVAAVPATTSHKNAQWGTAVPNGLQIGIWQEAKTTWAYCLIRNHGPKRVHYNDYFLGYWEHVSVWARPVGTSGWTQIMLSPARTFALKSVGPGKNTLAVKPGEKIVLQNAYYQSGDAVYFMPGFISLPPSASPAPPTHPTGIGLPILQSPQIASYTFLVDLSEFAWPETWTGPVEVAIEQKMNSDTDTKPQQASHENEIVLRSGALTLSPETLRRLREPYKEHVFPRGQVFPKN